MFAAFLAQSSSGGGSAAALALPLLMLVGFYFLLIRPQRSKQRAQQAMLSALEVGDDVMTSGGIFGTVIDIDEDEGVVTVEIAPNTNVKMLRQGISQRFVEDEDVDVDELEDEVDDDVTEDADRNP
jgi:preprotein translocase subunit YajC